MSIELARLTIIRGETIPVPSNWYTNTADEDLHSLIQSHVHEQVHSSASRILCSKWKTSLGRSSCRLYSQRSGCIYFESSPCSSTHWDKEGFKPHPSHRSGLHCSAEHSWNNVAAVERPSFTLIEVGKEIGRASCRERVCLAV